MLGLLLYFPDSCQHRQHWSVREDFSWQNSEATFRHPQQTNCCLLPLQVLWSPNELVSSQELRKGLTKSIYQAITYCHQPKQKPAKDRRKSRRNGSLRKGYRTSIFSPLLIVPFLCPFSYPFPSVKRHFMTSIVISLERRGTSSLGHNLCKLWVTVGKGPIATEDTRQ